ncbi:MAG: sigma 54-interacting transcriptional regulator [Deltaproteobacteria bacterium]|nr:sigma 54-interacting transcriptional regulator [Deltaproteobacteria bacterium]
MSVPNLHLEDLLQLLETNKKLLALGQLQKLFDFVLDEAIRLSKAERGFMILAEEQGERVVSARSFDGENLKRAREKFSRTVWQQVLQSGEPLLSVDAEQDPKLREAASILELQLTSILAVPIRLGDKVLGALYLDNRFTEGAFQEEQIGVLALFAEQAALAWHSLRAREASERQAEELARLQRQLADLNESLQKQVLQVERERDQVQAMLGRRAIKKGFEGIVGSSKALRKVLRTIEQLEESEVTVYIHGESGTGKELIARAIHRHSRRHDRSFIAVNCAAFSEQILDSELFGHVRGAFTGADRERLGLFEAAQGGTLFLDEVGEMSLGMQAKLLRALQEREIRPVGAVQSRKVDIRIVAASNRDLKHSVQEKAFREDLYYRLNVVRLDLPPLRDRPEDLNDLIHCFIQNNPLNLPTEFLSIEPEAMRLLIQYRWPGNIRELQNEIQRCLILGKGHITASLLSPQIRQDEASAATEQDLSLATRLKGLEKRLILQALEEARGNKRQAASRLGISRVKLYQKIKEYRLVSEYGRLSAARIRKALRETQGNKSLAAKRLGIGRRTLYERLEKMGGF